ncbi:hypothetical protein EC973_004253 [Apophysomyces ossiformis]|uniref:Arrestin C-terminal-like domain-containing protein n=1 Tax=Apophysomyces ossiformis TaxID=679940 RepID=A0A8H7ES08_9FUNG|nr:hypothetical protein EC973_004253 [Apophysomyces ossiformis]
MTYNCLKIHLENHTLILRGRADESAGCVLRGCVMLQLREKTRLKSLTLKFSGRMKVQWNENGQINRWSSRSLPISTPAGSSHTHRKVDLSIMEHEWLFLPPSDKWHVILPGQYVYPFELILPGDLAESVTDSPYGSVLYKLKAVAERPPLHANFVDRQQLALVRHIAPHFYDLPLRLANNHWSNTMAYEIIVPKRSFCRAETIPIEFSVRPHVPGEIHVRYLSCILKEYTTFITRYDQQHAAFSEPRTETRIVQFCRNEHFPDEGPEWHKTERLSVPRAIQAVHCDTDNAFYRIEHKLLFTMALVDNYGRQAEMRAAVPITITHGAYDRLLAGATTASALSTADLDTSEQDNVLPTYDVATQSMPYDPSFALHVDTPSSSPSSGIHTPSSEGADEWLAIPIDVNNHSILPYQLDLCRLPSYHTALQSHTAPIRDVGESLPSYETLCSIG